MEPACRAGMSFCCFKVVWLDVLGPVGVWRRFGQARFRVSLFWSCVLCSACLGASQEASEEMGGVQWFLECWDVSPFVVAIARRYTW